MSNRVVGIAAIVAVVLGLSACGGGGQNTATTVPAHKLEVVVTTTQLTDFAKTIAGGNITLYSMLKPNVDPHNYKPTSDDITALSKADLVVRNGAGLEPWLDATLVGADTRGTFVDASTGITLRYRDSARQQVDPHIWHSPINARIMVANITRALATQDPTNANSYRSNERAYDAQLDGLESDNKQSINPLANKNIVTTHDVLGYYADEFNLNVVGTVIPSLVPNVAPSAAQMTALTKAMKAANVKDVFAENGVGTTAAQGLAIQAGATLVQGADALYGDSLGPTGSDGDTYLKSEVHNTQEIVNNLR